MPGHDGCITAIVATVEQSDYWGSLDDAGDALEAFNPEVAEPAEPVGPRTSPVELDRPRTAAVEADRPRAAAVEPDRPRAAPVEPDRPRTAPVEPDRPRTAAVEPDRPRTAAVEPDRPRAAAVEPERPRAGTFEPDQPAVSLTTLASAGITPNGDEAIAIGQALCQSFAVKGLEASGTASGSSLVTTHAVFIDAAGRVRLGVNEPRNVIEAVQCVAKVLSDILPAHSYWLFRTRVLSRALTAPAEFATLNDFELELSVYERQNGTNLIRGLYQRWANLHDAKQEALPIGPPAAIVPSTAMVPPAALPAPQTRRSTATRRTPLIKAIMVLMLPVVALLGLAGGMLLSERRVQTPRNSPARAVTSEAMIPQGPEQPAAGVSQNSLADASGSTPVPSRRPVGASPAGTPSPRNARSVEIRARTVAPARSEVDAVSNAETVVTDVTASRASARTPSPVGTTALASTPVTTADAGSVVQPRRTTVIYDSADAGVAPPVPVVARLFAGLRPESPNVRWEVLTIEVVVNPDGGVDTAKGLVAPQTVGETVLLTQALSSIKSWAFKPATRDGVPVPYRQVIRLRDLSQPAP